MSGVKNTTFLEAVAAGIQHEKDFFDFCMKTYDELEPGPVKNFFYDLAEDSIEHLKMIEEIYRKFSGSQALPNLKYLGQVHKFHATAIQRLIKKLDRNLKKSANGNELEAMRLALQEAQDAAEAFSKLAEKFSDTAIKMLFRQIASFNKERSILLEGALVYQHPLADETAEQSYHLEVVSVGLPAQKPSVSRITDRKKITKSPKKAVKQPIRKTTKKARVPKKSAQKKAKSK